MSTSASVLDNTVHIYYDNTTVQLGKIQVMRGMIRVPIVFAAEMIQYYHRSELPEALAAMLPKDVDFAPILKDYSELVSMINKAKETPLTLDHPEGTFLEDEDPDHSPPFIKEAEVIGTAKEFLGEDSSKRVKGTAYIKEDKCNKKVYKDIADGVNVGVSIGFRCRFGEGGTYNGQPYLAKQVDMVLGHIAILPTGVGKCPTGKCGLNQDKDLAESVPLKAADLSIISPTNRFNGKLHSSTYNLNTMLSDPKLTYTIYTDSVGTSTNDLGFKKAISLSPSKVLDSVPVPLFEGSSMTPEETKLLEAKEAEIKRLADDASKTSKSLSDQIHDLTLKFETSQGLVAQKDATIATMKVELDRYKDTEKNALLQEVSRGYAEGPNHIVMGKPLKDHCLHDLKLIQEVWAGEETKKLEGGLPKPPQADHDAKVAGSDKALPVASVDEEYQKQLAEKRKGII